MYPIFRNSTKWIDPRRIPLTKRQIKRKNMQTKINTVFILNNYYSFFFNRAKILVKNSLKYGKIFSTYHGQYLVTYAFSPKGAWEVLASKQKSFIKGPLWVPTRKLLGNGLLVSEDPDHFVNRRMSISSFNHKKIKDMSYTMFRTTSKTVKEVKQMDKEIEVRDLVSSLTLDVIMKCVFGIDIKQDIKIIKKKASYAQDAMDRISDPRLSRFETFNLPYFKQFLNSTVDLYNFVDNVYEQKIKSSLEKDDLLSILINTTDENGKKMSKRQVLDEMLTIIMAGYESTSNVLTWAIVYLNHNPEEYKKLIEESLKIFSSSQSEEDTLKEIMGSTVCSNIIKETMRIAPPIWTIARMAIEDVEIDGKFVPKNSFVAISPYVTHRDPDIYNDPEKFIPDRWNNDFEKSLPAGAYHPFSGGSRGCIGEQFAMLEMKIILLCLSSQFRIKIYGKMPWGFDRVTYKVEKPLRAKIIPS
jgi:cytochrome P450